MGLPSGNRLKRRRDFQAVYQQGIRYSSPHLVLRVLPVLGEMGTNRLKSLKIGLSVSQKVSKQAVTRNRIKRRIRAAMRSLLPHLSPDWWIVIAARPPARECKYEHFLRELKQLLIQAKIYGHSRDYVL